MQSSIWIVNLDIFSIKGNVLFRIIIKMDAIWSMYQIFFISTRSTLSIEEYFSLFGRQIVVIHFGNCFDFIDCKWKSEIPFACKSLDLLLLLANLQKLFSFSLIERSQIYKLIQSPKSEMNCLSFKHFSKEYFHHQINKKDWKIFSILSDSIFRIHSFYFRVK